MDPIANRVLIDMLKEIDEFMVVEVSSCIERLRIGELSVEDDAPPMLQRREQVRELWTPIPYMILGAQKSGTTTIYEYMW